MEKNAPTGNNCFIQGQKHKPLQTICQNYTPQTSKLSDQPNQTKQLYAKRKPARRPINAYINQRKNPRPPAKPGRV